ncbi:MAG: hypothetical protein GQ574_15745 [Crocinitomix sp.]|nr:hypothetical protein [Crocinitomix sp.]
MQTPRNNSRTFIPFFVKGGLLILLFCCVTACNFDSPDANKYVIETVSTESSNPIIDSIAELLPEEDTVIYCSTEMSIDGTWALTNYFDPILKEKTIAKYRGQIPAWFAILLEIKKDAVFAYGSINDLEEVEIDCLSDTLTVFETNWGDWMLLNRGQELQLKEVVKDNMVDPNYL